MIYIYYMNRAIRCPAPIPQICGKVDGYRGELHFLQASFSPSSPIGFLDGPGTGRPAAAVCSGALPRLLRSRILLSFCLDVCIHALCLTVSLLTYRTENRLARVRVEVRLFVSLANRIQVYIALAKGLHARIGDHAVLLVQVHKIDFLLVLLDLLRMRTRTLCSAVAHPSLLKQSLL